MTDNLKKPQLRALQYWLADGVVELCTGFFFLLVALLTYFQAAVANPSVIKVLSIVSIFMIVGGTLGMRWLIQRIKEHTTYPRTGYIAYRSDRTGRKNITILAVIIAAMGLFFTCTIFITITHSELLDWIPGVGGLVTCFLLALVGYQVALPRFYALALITLLIGGGLAVSGLGELHGLPLFFALAGVVLLASGCLARRRYLHRNPPLTKSPDEH